MRLTLIFLLAFNSSLIAESNPNPAHSMIKLRWADAEDHANEKILAYFDPVINPDRTLRLYLHWGNRVIVEPVRIELVKGEAVIFSSNDLLSGLSPPLVGMAAIDVEVRGNIPEQIRIKSLSAVIK